MTDVCRTDEFNSWMKQLRNRHAVAKILVRIDRMSLGNPGDVRNVGAGVMEMRIDLGPGYRIYYVERGDGSVILLNGGDKSSQRRDISRALELAQRL